MAGAGAGADQGPGAPQAPGEAGPGGPRPGPDWAGLPEHVLMKVAEKHIAQTEAGWAAFLKVDGFDEGEIHEEMEERERDGNCLFVFAMVCKEWRKAQLEVGAPLRSRVTSDVILPGRVALAKWALAEGCPRLGVGGTMAHVAAQYGHMVLVRWLIQEQGVAMDKWVMASAAHGGNLELVRWLRGEGCDWDTWACEKAATAGRLRVLQWLRANGCPWDAKTCKFAALNGHLATLRWARENGCDWNAQACAEGAAQRGYLETLRWVRENGCNWNARTCISAAYGGHLEVLQWLRANGCPWSKHTCKHAAEQGHVEVLRWARENGCPWDAATRDMAAEELGYTDDFGNLVDEWGEPIQSDDDYAESSDEE